MLVCPACHTDNRDDAAVCSMCKAKLGRIAGAVPARSEPVGELHTVELPAGTPAAGPLRFEERALRRSSRPPPGMGEPAPSRSSRVPSVRPPTAASPPPPPSSTAEPSGLERALDLVARPFDLLLHLAVRGPDASLTLTDGELRRQSSALSRLALLLELWGAVVCVLPAMLPRASSVVPWVLMGLLVALAVGGRAWVARSWERGDDPNPLAMVAATFLSFTGISVVLSVCAAALLGGVQQPEGQPIRLDATGRLLVAIPLVLYGLVALAAALRDRVRAARQRGT